MRRTLARQARCAPLRSLHTESVNEVRKLTKTHHWSPPARQVTISIKQPEQATIQNVLDALATFQRPVRRVQGNPKLEHHTIFILATPSFASWLEASSEFIPQALQRVFGTSSPVEADVVCGVCDGLAPRPSSMKAPSGSGFSILHRPWKLDNLWDDSGTGTSPNLQSTLTFSACRGCQATLTLPLANTLFKNGRRSTLLLSRWKSSGNSFKIQRDQIEKQNVTMNLFTKMARFPRDLISCVPLTPLRRIHSGLGNIVRTIDFGQGGESDIGPASKELETSVSEYLAKGGHDQPTIDVWALVIPQDPVSRRRLGKVGLVEEILTTDMDALRARISPSTSKGRRYVGECINEGARLVRVLSGGGGWGPKEGLLSLDPQTTYSDSNEFRYDYSECSSDEQQTSALGSLAQEGAFIQFLVAAKNDEGPVNSLQRNEPEILESTRSSTVVGVVPSTVDDVHDEQREIPTTSDLQIYFGHFGMVSESGIFLRSVKPKKMNKGVLIRSIETKIDLPFSYFYQEDGNRGRPFSGIDEAQSLGDKAGSTTHSV